MKCEPKNNGFSLAEVLIAMGILAVGMVFVAGIFPVGLYFAAVSTEQTIAAVAADEAFAKVKIYTVGEPNVSTDDFDPNKMQAKSADGLVDFNDIDIFPALKEADPCEFTYPSNNIELSQRRYCWSALCRFTEEYDDVNNPNPPVQVTVFVCRKTGANLIYPGPGSDGTVSWNGPRPAIELDWPVPVKVSVDSTGKDDELKIRREEDKILINDGSLIVDDETGRIYRILERYASDPTKTDYDQIILLSRNWDNTYGLPSAVWVIPPALNSGKNPCIAVYQKTIRF